MISTSYDLNDTIALVYDTIFSLQSTASTDLGKEGKERNVAGSSLHDKTDKGKRMNEGSAAWK